MPIHQVGWCDNTRYIDLPCVEWPVCLCEVLKYRCSWHSLFRLYWSDERLILCWYWLVRIYAALLAYSSYIIPNIPSLTTKTYRRYYRGTLWYIFLSWWCFRWRSGNKPLGEAVDFTSTAVLLLSYSLPGMLHVLYFELYTPEYEGADASIIDVKII